MPILQSTSYVGLPEIVKSFLKSYLWAQLPYPNVLSMRLVIKYDEVDYPFSFVLLLKVNHKWETMRIS